MNAFIACSKLPHVWSLDFGHEPGLGQQASSPMPRALKPRCGVCMFLGKEGGGIKPPAKAAPGKEKGAEGCICTLGG